MAEEVIENVDRTKEILMKAVNNILRLNKESAGILHQRKLHHVKLIERSSKCTKDPNPLATAMCLLNKKYPIVVDEPKAIKYSMPTHLFPPKNSDMRRDSHRHGKILSKLESIDWWIENSPVPSEGAIKVIELLTKQQREEVRSYYSINWGKANIKWGPPIIQRQLVRTKQPVVDLPPNLRTAVLKEVLFPDITIPDSRVGTQEVEEVRETFNLNMEDKIGLIRQIRVLLNAMDPRERYLPILPNSGGKLIPLKHAMLHNNFVMSNIEVIDMDVNTSWEPIIENFIRCLYVEAKLSTISIADLKDICYNTTIMKKKVVDYLDLISGRNRLEYIWLKALFERGSTLECKKEGLTTCPMPSDCRETTIGNIANADVRMLQGNQMVSFKYGDIKGKFTHNGSWLLEISCNFTTHREFLSMLMGIGVYIKYRFTETTSTNYNRNMTQIRNFINKEPHRLLGMTPKEYANIPKMKNGEIVKAFTLNEETEYMTTGIYQMRLREDYEIVIVSTGQTIELGYTRKDIHPLSEEVVCNSPYLISSQNIKKTIKHAFAYLFRNAPTVVEKILENDFKWKNMYLNKFIKEQGRSISKLSRIILGNMVRQKVRSTPLICFVYLFAHRDPMAEMSPMKFIIPGGYEVDFEAKSGIWTYNSKTANYYLFGMKIDESVDLVTRGVMSTGILSGFRLVSPPTEGLKIMTARALERDINSIPEGASYNIYLNGLWLS